MSPAPDFDRLHKQRTDRAISEAYARLARDPSTRATFAELLQCVRHRGGALFTAPTFDARHHGIDVLVNLSRFAGAFVRRVADWPGCESPWRSTAFALAHQLVGRYPVPQFLTAAWYASEEAGAERQCGWFVRHAAGVRFRSLDLPMVMTRKMERIFLHSPAHLDIPRALRRAELMALGADAALVDAVMATRVAINLRHSSFWRTVWLFLVANRGQLDLAQVGPIVDFIESVRHEPIVIETPEGTVTHAPLQPSFSMRGRTAQSMMRLMEEWHRKLGMAGGGAAWTASPLRPMVVQEPPAEPTAPPDVWRFLELTNAEQLRGESAALRHCVASYVNQCERGVSRIWSLRVERGDKVRHVLTIEIDMRRRAIVQARGWRNRPACGKARRLLEEWADRERLRLLV